MPKVAVKKASEQKSNEEKAVTRRSEGGLSPHWDPLSGWSPSEFFSNPFAVMRRMNEEMDRTFGRFFSRENGGSMWSPAIEVSESKGQLRVRADFAGSQA